MSKQTPLATRLRAPVLRCGIAALTAAALAYGGASPVSAAGEAVSIPWRAGNSSVLQAGTREEQGKQSTEGTLPVQLYRHAGAGPAPFVVLLHGCGGLRHDAMWRQWVDPWVGLFAAYGIGAAVVDSFTPRGIEQVCTGGVVATWPVRRADDAYSVRSWLAAQPYVDARRIAVMGMSNGGRTVLAALRTTLAHRAAFAAGIALYPGCQSDGDSRFYAPLLVLIGRADTVAPAAYCEAMQRAQPAGAAPKLDLVVYPNAPHTFDMALPDRTSLGMRLGYDAEATADARRRVIEFLAAQGMMPSGRRP
jgi:dienelactone hydrolase